MEDRSTPIFRLLGDIKSKLYQLVEAITEYQKAETAQREIKVDTESQRVVRLPIEVEAYYEAEQRDRPVKSRREVIKMRLEFAGLGVAVVLAIITGITLYVFVKQLSEMRKATVAATRSADTASESMRVGQRAYLVFHHVALNKPPEVGQPLEATVELLNSGQTPAIDVSYFVQMQILDGYPTDIRYGQLLPATPIGAGQKIIPTIWTLTKLTASQKKNIMAEPAFLTGNTLTLTNAPRLFVYGIARYNDVFGAKGESEFCAVYLASQNQFLGCPTHNTLKYEEQQNRN